jgi:hypothetical protein
LQAAAAFASIARNRLGDLLRRGVLAGRIWLCARSRFFDGGWAVLIDRKGRRPNILLQRRKAKREGRCGWIHLNRYSANQAAEAERYA